jgi:ferredoxin
MTLHIKIDRDVCIGSGTCVRLARGTFELDADNIANVVDPEIATEEEILRAERSCPTGAITLDKGAQTPATTVGKR